MITENEVLHMNVTDLRRHCREHSVSPAGNRENLQERLCEALGKISMAPPPAEYYNEDPYAGEYAPPPPQYDPRAGPPSDYDPYGAPSPHYEEPPREQQYYHTSHDIEQTYNGPHYRSEHEEVYDRKPTQSQNSNGVAHMFGKDTQLKASRPTKRMTAQDMDDEHVIAAGAPHRKDPDAVPHQRIPGWLDSHSASDALNFDSTSEVPPPRSRSGMPNDKISWLKSDGASGALRMDGGELAVPRKRSGVPNEKINWVAVQNRESPYAVTLVDKKADLVPIDEDTASMIRGLSLADLRAMLRKRGVNPAGSRQVLQERLQQYLTGDNMDCDFTPAPSACGSEAGDRDPPSPRSSVSVPPSPVIPRRALASTLGYLFGGQ